MPLQRTLIIALGLLSGSPVLALPESWSSAHTPFRIHGDSYYVGTQGLAAILIRTDQGLVLIDVPMEENVAQVQANIVALGFRLEDIKLILNSHAHYDHAGGIASMVAATGASVKASPAQAIGLRSGGDDPNDPQYGSAAKFSPVEMLSEYSASASVSLGALQLRGYATPGHTPGSTSWSWQSCEKGQCLTIVYADSLTAMSAGDYRYSDPAQPQRVEDFRRGLQLLAHLPCDVLVTPHPEASGFFERVQRRDAGEETALIDKGACQRYAETAAERLDALIAEESEAAQAP